MSAASILIALFNAASSIIAADFFFSAFADKLVGKKAKKRIVSFFAFFIFFFAPLLISNSTVNMGVLIVCTYLITLNYDMRFYNKLLLTALCIAFNVAAEISAGFLIMTSFSIDFNEAKTGIGFYLLYFDSSHKRRHIARAFSKKVAFDLYPSDYYILNCICHISVYAILSKPSVFNQPNSCKLNHVNHQ